jgi:hypothetical protein
MSRGFAAAIDRGVAGWHSTLRWPAAARQRLFAGGASGQAVATFLVVELPSADTASAVFTQANPGIVLDAFVDLTGRQPGQPLRVLAHAWGTPPEALASLLRGGEASYPGFRLRRRRPDGSWLATFAVPEAALGGSAVASLDLLVSEGLRVAWVRVEEGVTYSRALVPAGTDVLALVRRVEAAFAARGAEADVAVEEAADERLKEWVAELEEFLSGARA